MPRVLAVDLGATSVRVAAVELDDPRPTPKILHRYRHEPVVDADGGLRWDWDRIVAEIEHGLELGHQIGRVASIGVDGWAVDYGLLDGDGKLLSAPHSYRSARTSGWEAVADRIGRDRLYARTGIQLMGINTIFQLAAHDPDELASAARLLLLPDLLVHHLTGWVGAERSNASSTGLLDPDGRWDTELAAEVGVRRTLLPEVHQAPAAVGAWRGTPVHLVGSHDTASAFIGVPGVPTPGTVVVSSGTWVLVGAERDTADTSDAAQAANFSNEHGALGGYRFLRNVTGFWALERCRDVWGHPPFDDLVAAAMALPSPPPALDLRGERFTDPSDMPQEIAAAAGLDDPGDRGLVTRCILESIAATTAEVVRELAELRGVPATELFVVGGGSRLEVMNQLFAEHSGLPVTVGSAEATALGNAMVQSIALGHDADLTTARRRFVAGT
ncbi:rhamnulokinase [Nitriliruptoraceae bacterium ZYF776]|nr:rhamnulokinase [Profundirhabdus halotolerans]